METDNSAETVDIQRAIAADTRDHRRLLFEEWRLNVQSASDAAITMQSLGTEYAQIALKSAFIANAGALVALPPLMQWLPHSQRVLIPSCAWCFVVGLLLAATCAIVAYANFMLLATIFDKRAEARATELAANYGLRDPSILSEPRYVGLLAAEKRFGLWALMTMVAAIAAGIASYILFLLGALAFRQIVM